VLGACSHVRLTNSDEAFFAVVLSQRIIEESGNLVLLLVRLSSKVPPLLRNFLAKPNSLSNAVLPVVSLEHDSTDLLLFRLFDLVFFFLHLDIPLTSLRRFGFIRLFGSISVLCFVMHSFSMVSLTHSRIILQVVCLGRGIARIL
jgi:hypothetical protein